MKESKYKKFIVCKQYGMMAKIKFVSNLGVYWGVKLVKTVAISGTQLQSVLAGLELNWTWISEKDNSFHSASSLCHTSSTILAGEG